MLNKRMNITPEYSTCRVINGGWQLSEGHALQNTIDTAPVLKAFHQLVEQGFNTFDCADIYTGVEELIGQFILERKKSIGRDDTQVHTKFVPDLSILGEIDFNYVERIIVRSLKRLNKERLDLVQFHWWDYNVNGCLDIAGHLVRLKEKGLIANLGTTNFDTKHLKELVKAGYPLVSNQTQYSVLDRRPEKEMVDFCQTNNVKLLCYGSLAGGFLSERWIDQAKPSSLENRSLVKYQLVIEDSLGWDGYQKLLKLMKEIGLKRGCSLSNVATMYVLNKPAVAAAIIGTRSERHILSNQQIFKAELLPEDYKAIDKLINQYPIIDGEPFELERLEGGKHRNIMKMNLNEE
ncbi:aldo/keto reductase [Zophobihabitans entericus]|uniref:Aldo/keto reductase n=1 Tax=Zophobihabitans entericus TaxID=1635327 RepID=A0A6G9IES3_9GAMM|nr:aldo/keto reductase [Zophobihabitans entericus]QIQ22090.1 aldo/keto reductase [Zophobihabitans entericus]